MADQFDASPAEAPIESIRPNARQPRTKFDDTSIAELAASIDRHGVLQPLVVRQDSGGTYELIAGERRLRAAKLAGLDTVPIVVRDADDRESLEIAIVENVQREDINCIECAQAYRQLADEFGLTQEAIAEKVGKSRVAVTNTMRLLRLPRSVQQGLVQGKMSEGHGRALLALESEAAQLAMFDRILESDLSVREVEKSVRGNSPAAKSPPARQAVNPNWRAVQDAMSTHFGAPVTIKRSGPRGGQVQIEFYSDDDLERIVETVGIEL